jgi:hypothetical protein
LGLTGDEAWTFIKAGSLSRRGSLPTVATLRNRAGQIRKLRDPLKFKDRGKPVLISPFLFDILERRAYVKVFDPDAKESKPDQNQVNRSQRLENILCWRFSF